MHTHRPTHFHPTNSRATTYHHVTFFLKKCIDCIQSQSFLPHLHYLYFIIFTTVHHYLHYLTSLPSVFTSYSSNVITINFLTFITVSTHCIQPHLLSYFPFIHWFIYPLPCSSFSLSYRYFPHIHNCLHTHHHCPHQYHCCTFAVTTRISSNG